MENSPKTVEQFQDKTISISLSHAIKGLSIAKATQEEVADFISKSTQEPQEEIMKRINKRANEIAKALACSASVELGLPQKKFEHLFDSSL